MGRDFVLVYAGGRGRGGDGGVFFWVGWGVGGGMED